MPGMKKHIKLISKYMWDEKEQNSPRRRKKREIWYHQIIPQSYNN